MDLIAEKASGIGKQIELRDALSKGAFELLMSGERESHDKRILQTAREVSNRADTLVLAQCSMARLAPSLSVEVGKPVFSSPRLGVECLKGVLG